MKSLFKGLVLSIPLVISGLPSVTLAAPPTQQIAQIQTNDLRQLGEDTLNTMLTNQKKAFEDNTPLQDTSESKLTETDEAVLLFLASTQIDNRKLQNFTYSIENIKVTNDENGKAFIEAYIIRSFKFQDSDVPSELGDEIKIEINNASQHLEQYSIKGLRKESVKDFQLTSNTAEAKEKNEELTLDEFLSRYEAEVDDEPIVMDKKEDYKMQFETQATGYKFYGSTAASYARKYAITPNSDYKYYSGADCTNFVSQALRAGGITNFTEWKPYTDAWINAGAFRNYIRKSGGILMSTVKDDYAHAFLGDVYHYDYRNKLGIKKPDGWMDHTAIVTSFANPKILVSYHSSNRKDVPREFFTSVEGGDRFLSDIK